MRYKKDAIFADNAEAMREFAEDVNSMMGGRKRCKLVAVKVAGQKAARLCSSKGLKMVRGSSSRYALSVTDMLRVAFSKRYNRSAAADEHGVSSQTIQRVLPVAAHVLLEAQFRQLSNFKSFLVEKKPDVAAAALMWDETSQSLALDAVPGAEIHQQRSTWTVLVARLHFTVAFLGTAGVHLKMYKEFVFPPIPLASNSSSAIGAGLFLHPFAKPMLEMVQEILLASRIRCLVHEVDAHLANEKLHYARWKNFQDISREPVPPRMPVLIEKLHCFNHQTNLSLVEAVQNIPKVDETGGALIPNIYCGTLFMRMGGHFLRVAGSIRSVVEGDLLLWRQNPSQADLQRGKAFREELSSYLVANLRHHDRQMAMCAGAGLAFGFLWGC